jgi:hypothetical protein
MGQRGGIVNHQAYNITCTCPQCRASTIWQFARSALPPIEFVKLAKQHHMNDVQQGIVDAIMYNIEVEKLQQWNAMSRKDA